MLEVTGGAMATLIPANAAVDWPRHYVRSSLCRDNAARADALVQQVRRGAALLPATCCCRRRE
jgi:hypothetical protein